jgi:DnaJ-domain-containing protein 1
MVEIENPPLDSEDWKIVFQAYADYPVLAFILAQHLDYLKKLSRADAEAAIERAVESLMPLTNFRDAGRTVYLLAVAGNLQPDHEQTIREITDLPR